MVGIRDDVDRRRPRRFAVTLLLALIFLVVVGVPARIVGNLYAHLDALSANVRSGQLEAAGAELDHVTAFYEIGRSWGLQWLADYLFKDAFLQRAAYAYVAKDYQAVVQDLQGKVDDPRAAFLLGCAKFRLAEHRYRGINGKDARAAAQKTAIIQEIIEVINPDFERAVRADANDTFAYKWNYDLTSDRDAIKRALDEPQVADPQEPERPIGTGTPVRRRRG
jgi:hypothetical protein